MFHSRTVTPIPTCVPFDGGSFGFDTVVDATDWSGWESLLDCTLFGLGVLWWDEYEG